jgi:UDP-N-acetylglucosamine 2-epimerase (non-hydrolysing)
MRKILIVIGTRPEAIKMAPLALKLKENKTFNVKICVTAQHRELLDDVMDQFKLYPDYDLDIMKKNQSLYDVTSSVLQGMEEIFKKYTPDIVLVHGDTTTTFTSALAANYEKIMVGHIEAGLRTYNRYSPWPEEINRNLVSKLATFHYCPTNDSVDNLVREGVPEKNCICTGNTVIDSLFYIASITQKESFHNSQLELKKPYILVTCHRRENYGDGAINICTALIDIVRNHPQYDIIFSVHPNPNIRNSILEQLSGVDGIHLIEPQSYIDFVLLMKNAFIILTDSGGIQEEAPSLNVPVLVLRETTERPEAIEAGGVVLVGTVKEKIVNTVKELIEDPGLYNRMSKAVNPYGDGKSCNRISEHLEKNL